MRLAKLADLDFARARCERIGVQAVKVERLSFVDARGFARQAQATILRGDLLSMRRSDFNSLGSANQGGLRCAAEWRL